MIFWKRGGGHAYPKNFVADLSTSRKKAQHSFPKRGRVGIRGRLEVFRKFIRFGEERRP